MARPWTTKEQRIVREIYPISGSVGVQIAGVDRSNTAIGQYARYLGIKCHFRGAGPIIAKSAITLDGVTDNLKNHAERNGLNPVTVYARISKQGWSPKRALTTPARAYDMTNKRAQHGNNQ